MMHSASYIKAVSRAVSQKHLENAPILNHKEEIFSFSYKIPEFSPMKIASRLIRSRSAMVE